MSMAGAAPALAPPPAGDLKKSAPGSQPPPTMSQVDAALTDACEQVGLEDECPGTFAAGGVVHPFVLPLPHIDGFGTLGLPVSQKEAVELMEAAELAPHGRGEKTVIDRTVRDCRRVNQAKVTFLNPAWDRTIQRCCSQAKESLGVLQGVRAELYNLLVYGPGGHFAPHRDSEKVEGMFGTLVVSLPSVHSGGALVARHRGEEVRFETASAAPTQIQWFAFYADVEHELQRVATGHRVVLVYNLIRVGTGKIPRAPSGEYSPAALAFRKVADEWAKVTSPSFKRLNMLEHQYTDEGLDWDALKGRDAGILNALRESEAFDLQLVLVRLTEYGDDVDCHYGYGGYGGYGGDVEIHDSQWEFSGWETDPEGDDLPAIIESHYTKKDAHANASELLQGEDYFEDQDPDDEEHEGPTGNEGAPMSRWYTAAALVLRPKAFRLKSVGLAAMPVLLKMGVVDSDSLCGFKNPQAMYNNVMANETPAKWTAATQGSLLLRLGDASGGLSLASARTFLESLVTAPADRQLADGLHAVLSRYGWADEALREAAVTFFKQSSVLNEKSAEAAFRLAVDMFSREDTADAAAHDGSPDIIAVLTMREIDDVPAMSFELCAGDHSVGREVDPEAMSTADESSFDIKHPSKTVSKRHANITVIKGAHGSTPTLTITDVGSSSRTCRGERKKANILPAHTPECFEFGETFFLGGVMCSFEPPQTKISPQHSFKESKEKLRREVLDVLVRSLGKDTTTLCRATARMLSDAKISKPYSHWQQTAEFNAQMMKYNHRAAAFNKQYSFRCGSATIIAAKEVLDDAGWSVAASAIAKNGRFHPVLSVAAAVAKMVTPPPEDSDGRVAREALVASAMAHMATKADYSGATVSEVEAALLCAIEGGGIERLAPLSGRFSPNVLVKAMALLVQSTRADVAKSLASDAWSQVLVDAVIPLLMAKPKPAYTYSYQTTTTSTHNIAPVADTVMSAIALGRVGGSNAAERVVEKIVAGWPVMTSVVNLTMKLSTQLGSEDKRSPAFVTLVRQCIAAVRPLTRLPAPLSCEHQRALAGIPSNAGLLHEVVKFLNGTRRTIEFRGREFTWTGSMTHKLEKMHALTVTRTCTKACRVHGRLQVTKSVALHAANVAKADRDKQAADVEKKQALLSKLEKLLPRDTGDVELRAAKRLRVDDAGGAHSADPLPGSGAAAVEVIDLTADE